MKSILIVIYAHYVKLIIDGKKTVEVRKNKNLANAIKKLIAEQGGCWVYIYVAKGHEKLYFDDVAGGYVIEDAPKSVPNYLCNGKVVARFWCDKVEEIKCNFIAFSFEKYITETLNTEQLEKLSCLTRQELSNYIGNVNVSLGQTRGYAIHISKLEVFEKPRELYEFNFYENGCHLCKDCLFAIKGNKCDTFHCNSLTKAPQNYCYIESEE